MADEQEMHYGILNREMKQIYKSCFTEEWMNETMWNNERWNDFVCKVMSSSVFQ